MIHYSRRPFFVLGPITRESPRFVPSDAAAGIELRAAGADRLADALTMNRPDAVAAVAHEGHFGPANPRVAERRRMVSMIAKSLGEHAKRLAIKRGRSGRHRSR